MEEIKKNQKNKTDYFLPLSIVIAALFIAGAWIYTAGVGKINIGKESDKTSETETGGENLVSSDDHIRGSADAAVKIVEFSDMECPFCKNFHLTMLRVMDEYGKDGRVAWIYKHYPLDMIHPKAQKSAEASECAAELGGNDGFWNYLDRYFEVTPSNNQIDLNKLPEIAESIGLDKGRFEECLNSGKYAEKVKNQAKSALNAGARGTPYSIVISKDGTESPINGAFPFEDFKDQYGVTQKGVKSFIEEALK